MARGQGGNSAVHGTARANWQAERFLDSAAKGVSVLATHFPVPEQQDGGMLPDVEPLCKMGAFVRVNLQNACVTPRLTVYSKS